MRPSLGQLSLAGLVPLAVLAVGLFAAVALGDDIPKTPPAPTPAPAVAPEPQDVEKWIQEMQSRQQKQSQRLFEQMQKQFHADFPGMPKLPLPKFTAPAFTPPTAQNGVVVDRPNFKSVTYSQSSSSSYSINGARLTAKIVEGSTKANVQGAVREGKFVLDRIELTEAGGPRVYQSLDQVPATARDVIVRHLARWEKESSFEPDF